MELRQLRYFTALAEQRHFGRAAETLHISQPSLSQQIKVLEENLSVVLFDRSRRHVALTPDGEALLPYAKRMLELADDVRTEFADRLNLLSGIIRLGATPTLGGYLLPKLLKRFHEKFPGLDITITEDGSDRLSKELAEGSLDLALLVDDPGVKHKAGAFEFLLKERIVAALPPDHVLGDRVSVALTELKQDGFILCREGYHLRSLTTRACEEAGFTPRVTVSGTDVDTALRFVRSGLGVTLIPETVVGSAREVATPMLRSPKLFRHVGIAYNPQRYLSKAASALLQFLREASESL